MIQLPPQKLEEEEEEEDEDEAEAEAEVVVSGVGPSLLSGSCPSIVGVLSRLFPELGSGGHENNMLVAAFTVVLFFCLPRNLHAGIFIFCLLLASMLTTGVVYLYSVVIVHLCRLYFLPVFISGSDQPTLTAPLFM